jgi:PA14 domain-containing protein
MKKWLLLLAALVASNANGATIWLEFTCPSFNDSSATCGSFETDSGWVFLDGSPLRDLKQIVVVGRRFSDPEEQTAAIVPAVGMEGRRMAIAIALPDSASRSWMGYVKVYAEDASHRSCRYLGATLAYPQYIAPPPIPGSGGLRGEYYSGTNFNTFAMERTDTLVAFDWALGPAWLNGPSDYYSSRWTGKVIVPTAGAVTFYVNADDGRRLTVDGSVIMDQFVGGSSETAATVQLTAGQHPIKLEWYEGWGAARCILSWSGPGWTKQVIPKGALMP